MVSEREPSELREVRPGVALMRTWELELFISGATVFALLQAPAIVERWWIHTDPHLDGTLGIAAFFTYYYAKLSLYTLIATFVLHLVTRAYWVALVGLRTVYPGGVRWGELKLGPEFTKAYRARLPTLSTMIERVDRLSSLLFSGGAVVLLLCLLSLLLIALVGAFAGVVSTLLLGGRHLVIVAAALVLIVTLLPAITKSIDLRRGRRGTHDAGGSPVMARLATASYHLSFTSVVGPLSLVLASNLGKRTASWALSMVFLGIISVFIVRDVLIGNDAIRADSYVYLPDEPPVQFADPNYYLDRRRPGDVLVSTPAIQSEIIRDPYVRLFVPISPARHNRLIAERCPGVPTFDDGLRIVGRYSPDPPDIEPLLRCLASLQPLSLDGQPLPAPKYTLTLDADSGIRGIVTFIPTAALAPGEHLLRVEGLPRAESETLASGARRPPFLIPFWL